MRRALLHTADAPDLALQMQQAPAGDEPTCSHSHAAPGSVAHLDDAAQVGQAANGCAVRAGEELEEQLALVAIKLVDHLPQPLHHLQQASSGGTALAGISAGKLQAHMLLQSATSLSKSS